MEDKYVIFEHEAVKLEPAQQGGQMVEDKKQRLTAVPETTTFSNDQVTTHKKKVYTKESQKRQEPIRNTDRAQEFGYLYDTKTINNGSSTLKDFLKSNRIDGPKGEKTIYILSAMYKEALNSGFSLDDILRSGKFDDLERLALIEISKK